MRAHMMKYDRQHLAFSRHSKCVWPCGQSRSENITSSAKEECVSAYVP